MSNEERKAAIREALGHAKVVPVATPKTECCSHCSLKVGTVGVAPYYPPQAPPQGQPMPFSPYSGGQITIDTSNFKQGNAIYQSPVHFYQSFISSPYPATPSKP